MPNWVYNRISFYGKKKTLEEIKKSLSDGKEGVTFNNIVPSPDELILCLYNDYLLMYSDTLTEKERSFLKIKDTKTKYNKDKLLEEFKAMNEDFEEFEDFLNSILSSKSNNLTYLKNKVKNFSQFRENAVSFKLKNIESVKELKDLFYECKENPEKFKGFLFDIFSNKSFIDLVILYGWGWQEFVPDAYKLGEIQAGLIKRYGTSSWFNYNVMNWGTKWDCRNSSLGEVEGPNKSISSAFAYIFDKEDEEIQELKCDFETAYSAPLPFFNTLHKIFPSVYISMAYADEDLGNNCDAVIYIPGESEPQENYPTDVDSFKFACEVWDYDETEMRTLMKEE